MAGTFPSANDLPTALPQPSDGVAQTAPVTLSTAPAQVQIDQGAQEKQLGDEVDRYALHLDTLQAQDAINKLRTAKDDLTFGPQNGFMNIKGIDVLKPTADGTPMMQSFPTQFQTVSDAIGGHLSGRAAQMYTEVAAKEKSAFSTELANHSLRQTEVANKSIYDDGVAQDLTEAARHADDPSVLDSIILRSQKRTAYYASQQGLKPDALVVAAGSNIARTAIESKIRANDGPGALNLYRKYAGQLDAKDALEVGASIKTVQIGQNAQSYVASLLGGGTPTAPAGGVTPTNVHRAIVGQESGGQQTDAQGNTLTSVDGAKGAGQMLPETFNKYALPGERIDNRDDNLAASRRAIDDYYRKFNGDYRRIATAYFSGEGNVADPGSPTPWKVDYKDGNGKSVSSYVADVAARLGNPGGAPRPAPGPVAPISPQTVLGPMDPMTRDASGNPVGLRLPDAGAVQPAKADGVKPGPEGTPPTVAQPEPAHTPGFLDINKMMLDTEAWWIHATADNQARHASDPAMLSSSQALINQQHEAMKARVEFAKLTLYDKVNNYLEHGGPPGPDGQPGPATERPPADVWNQLDPQKQRSIDETLKHNAKGPGYDPPDTPEAKKVWMKINDFLTEHPGEAMKLDFAQLIPVLPKARLDQLQERKNSIATGDQKEFSSQIALSWADHALSQAGVNTKDNANEADALLRTQMHDEVTRWLDNFQVENKRAPKSMEVRQYIDDLLIMGKTNRAGFWGRNAPNLLGGDSDYTAPQATGLDDKGKRVNRGTPDNMKFLFTVPPSEMGKFYVPYKDIPADRRALVEQKLSPQIQGLNDDAKQRLVEQTYLRALMHKRSNQ